MAIRRRRAWLVALATWAVAAAGTVRAQDDDAYGSQVFEGEPAGGRPLEGVPDESRRLEARPSEAMPLDAPVDSRVTDSEAADGPTVDPGPREMIGEDDDAGPAGGALREAEPADDDDGGVESGPQVDERVREEPGYGSD